MTINLQTITLCIISLCISLKSSEGFSPGSNFQNQWTNQQPRAASRSSASTSPIDLLIPRNNRPAWPLSMNKEDDSQEEAVEFKPNRPIDLPSLNPQDAGPMYATCRSVTGVEREREEDEDDEVEPASSSSQYETAAQEEADLENFTPNKPIELESLRSQQQQPTTFLGLEPKGDGLRQKDGSMVDAGLPLFTSTIIMMMSVYFIYLALFGEDVLMDPSMPLAGPLTTF